MLCFSRPSSKDVTNLGTLPQSRECRDAKKLYRNNGYFIIHHRVFSKHNLAVVYTKFEVKRSILEGCMPIQTENPVFETLTVVPHFTHLPSISAVRSQRKRQSCLQDSCQENHTYLEETSVWPKRCAPASRSTHGTVYPP